MSEFLHRMAEGLRAREAYLEDHNDVIPFDSAEGQKLRREYDALMLEVRDFKAKVDAAAEKGVDFDEHFERTIGDQHSALTVKIDSWVKTLPEDATIDTPDIRVQ